ncbi:MAG: TAXI family TRAP transporter solute-binding subunit [bacterium]|jgi:TRAP transporter TAXI family solute receptor
MSMKRIVLILVSVLIITSLCACSQPAANEGDSEQQAPESGVFVGAGGGVGGVDYTVMSGLAELIKEIEPSITMQVVPGGGLINPPRVGTKEIDLALMFPPVMAAARDGRSPFDTAYPDINIIAQGFGFAYGQMIVPADSELESIGDIFEKEYPLQVAVDRVGTTDEWLLQNICAYYDANYIKIAEWGGKVVHAGYGDQAVLFKDRHVDAIFGNIGVPWTTAMEAQLVGEIKVLPFPEDLQDYLNKEFAFSKGEIPAGAYGVVTEPLPTVASITTLGVNKNVPEDVVYNIAKIIYENTDRVHQIHDMVKGFDRERAAEDVGIPYHPGAVKYYKEIGLMK